MGFLLAAYENRRSCTELGSRWMGKGSGMWVPVEPEDGDPCAG